MILRVCEDVCLLSTACFPEFKFVNFAVEVLPDCQEHMCVGHCGTRLAHIFIPLWVATQIANCLTQFARFGFKIFDELVSLIRELLPLIGSFKPCVGGLFFKRPLDGDSR